MFFAPPRQKQLVRVTVSRPRSQPVAIVALCRRHGRTPQAVVVIGTAPVQRGQLAPRRSFIISGLHRGPAGRTRVIVIEALPEAARQTVISSSVVIVGVWAHAAPIELSRPRCLVAENAFRPLRP
jgi:hypothetical protein